MTRVFQIVLGQQVLTDTPQREEGSTMRYAKALPRYFRFLPGLHGVVAPEHLSPCRSSMVLATRETRSISFTLGGLSSGVVFSSRWLRRSRSSTALPNGDYPPRPRRGKNCGCATLQTALVVDTIAKTTPQRLVAMPEACRGGWRGTASSTGPVACLADRRGLDTTAVVFAISQRLLPPTMCGNPNPDASFDRGC